MMKTSSPRTFSWISTNTSRSEKRRTLALVSGRFSEAAMASASGRLLLQARIFMRAEPRPNALNYLKNKQETREGLLPRGRRGMYQSVTGL